MRKAPEAPEKSGASCVLDIDEAKTLGLGFEKGFPGEPFLRRALRPQNDRNQGDVPIAPQNVNRIVGLAPPVAGTAKRSVEAPWGREAGGTALGNVAYLTAHSSARLNVLKIPHDRDKAPGGGVRGKVRGYSHASRLRLMARINTIIRTAPLPCFVTLTFPDLFPTWEIGKRAIDTLGKRWRRRWPSTAVLWRMEAIDRKSGSSAGQVAPHFHLMVWGEFDAEKAKLDWFEICGNSEYAHYRHGCDVQELRNWREAMGYVAKYLSKESDAVCEGRCWGLLNRKALPVDRSPVRVRLSWKEAWALRRLIRKAIASKIGRTVKHAQSLYTEDAECLLKFLALIRGNRRFRDGSQQTSRADQWRAILTKNER